MELVLPVLVTVGIIIAILGTQMGSGLDPVQARLQQIAVRPRSLEELELQRPLSDRTLKPIIRGLAGLMARFYPANTMKSLTLKLKRAGMETTSAEFFLGVKGFAAIVGAVAVSALVNLMTSDGTQTLIGAAGGLLVGFMAPDFYLGNRAGGRGKQILETLPDALDLLTISVEAGLGFDAALVKVTEKLKGPLSDEFKRAASEQRVGKSRQEALRGITDRVEQRELELHLGDHPGRPARCVDVEGAPDPVRADARRPPAARGGEGGEGPDPDHAADHRLHLPVALHRHPRAGSPVGAEQLR